LVISRPVIDLSGGGQLPALLLGSGLLVQHRLQHCNQLGQNQELELCNVLRQTCEAMLRVSILFSEDFKEFEPLLIADF